MIETVSDCNQFQLENTQGDWIVHVVPVEDNVHPADTSPSVIFIKNILTNKTYYFSIDHPDSIPSFPFENFVEILKGFINIKWALDKKTFNQFLSLPNVYDANLCSFFTKNDIIDSSEFETPAHNLIRRNSNEHSGINRIIPLMKHKEYFDDMCKDVFKMVDKFQINTPFLRVNDIVIQTLGDMEMAGIFVDKELFYKHFNHRPNKNGLVFSQYNVYTSTGRPSNRFGGINYAALNHTDGSRSCFTSRHGQDGKMVLVDYTAFHPRIICALTNYSIPVETDIYEYLARLYFQKKDVDESDVTNAKKLTFRQLYGGVEDRYEHIKYLANLKTFINEQWKLFQENGYVMTPFFKRKITTHHIQDPSPAKIFNYILQASEGELAIPKIQSVQSYLKDKKTKAVLYTYDSVLYDFYKGDGLVTLNEIREIMSFNFKFPMKTYIGNSYQDLKLISM